MGKIQAELRRLVEHTAWADDRVAESLARCQPLDAALRKWFAHVATAERIYYERAAGADPWPQDFWPDLDLETSRRVAAAAARHFLELFERLSDGQLRHPVSYRNSSGTRFTTPVNQLVEQVALHGAYHRGQIAARLRELGHEPPVTDLIIFLREVERPEETTRS